MQILHGRTVQLYVQALRATSTMEHNNQNKIQASVTTDHHYHQAKQDHGTPTGNREGHRQDGRLPGEISQPHPIWCVQAFSCELSPKLIYFLVVLCPSLEMTG
jgi:hypothetical protein